MHFDPWSAALTAVNLGVVIFVLKVLLFGPISKILQEREDTIENSLSKAATAQQEAQELLENYQKQMENAKKEAQAIIEKATKIGEQKHLEITSQAREEAQQSLDKAKREIQGEKAKALEEIRKEAAVLAVMAAGKLINQQLNSKQHLRLVEEYIDEVGELQ